MHMLPQIRVTIKVNFICIGIMQHHDAITGTEKQHVTNDYHRMLEDGFQDCLSVAKDALK